MNILCCYDNSGYLHFVYITQEEFDKEVLGNYTEHEPIRGSSLEELSLYMINHCWDDPEQYCKLARLYYSVTEGVKRHAHPAMNAEYYH